MSLKLVSPRATDPVSLDEAKAHLRVDYTDDDSSISAYLAAAIAAVDGPNGAIGRALIDQTWDLYLDRFPHSHCFQYSYRYQYPRHTELGAIEIPLPPLIEVTGVFYLDSDNVEQTVDAATYLVDTASQPGRIALLSGQSWPCPQQCANAVRVRFRAGYLDTSSPPVAAVPDPIKAAILLYTGALYSNRDQFIVSEGRAAAVPMPWGAEQLLAPYNVIRGFA